MAETNQLKPSIDKIKKNLIETISPKILPQKTIPLCVQIMRILAKGWPVSPEQIASTGSFPINEAGAHFSDLQKIGMAELDDTGKIIAMVLSLKPTQHHFRVNGNNLFTWCAIDTLFLPAVLNQSADVESTCPITNTQINLTIAPEGIKKIDPQNACLSIVAPGVTKGITATCGSNESCSPDSLGSQGSFCSNVHFFSSFEAGSKWLTGFEGGHLLSIEEAYKLAYDIWAKPFLEAL